MTPSSKARTELLADGQLLRLTLAAPKANVLDRAMVSELVAALDHHGASPRLKAILLSADGPHFSFGASVAEHRKEEVRGMLADFHHLFRRLAELAIPTVAAVRGACLGGGLELAAWCSWIVAAPDAGFAQPEIKLGVFAPLASLLLPWRLGGGAALDLLVSGRTIDAPTAARIGLVHAVADDPVAAAMAFAAEHLLPRSASSLRFAERAARHELAELLARRLPALEALYLDQLMETADANEGLAAFIAKRPPRWAAEERP